MERKLIITLLFVLVCAVASSLYDAYKYDDAKINLTQNNENDLLELKNKSQTENQDSDNEDFKNNEDKIVVYIEGAIAKPGLVYLDNDARIGEVAEMAGGFLANADTKNLNLAEKITDGQKITVPFKNEVGILNATSSDNSDMVNINTATLEELQTLPRVGPSTAKNIIEYREKRGKFKTIDEIKNVPRIGEKTFEKFKDKIKV